MTSFASRRLRSLAPTLRYPSAVFAAALLAAIALPHSSAAQSGGGYTIVSSSFDAEASSMGGAYTLEGSSGAHDAGTLSGGGYTVTGGFWSGSGSQIVAVPPPDDRITAFHVWSASPNPGAVTSVLFDLPTASMVHVRIFDAGGQLVRRLLDGARPAGRHLVRWDGRSDDGAPLVSGLYFLRVDAGVLRGSARVLLMPSTGGGAR